MLYDEFTKNFKIDYKFWDFIYDVKKNKKLKSIGLVIVDDLLQLVLKKLEDYPEKQLRKLLPVIAYSNYLEYKKAGEKTVDLNNVLFDSDLLYFATFGETRQKLDMLIKESGLNDFKTENLFLILFLIKTGQFVFLTDSLLKLKKHTNNTLAFGLGAFAVAHSDMLKAFHYYRTVSLTEELEKISSKVGKEHSLKLMAGTLKLSKEFDVQKRSVSAKKGSESRYGAIKRFVLQEYKKGKFKSKRNASIKITEQVRTSPEFKGELTKENMQLTIYSWLLKCKE